MLGGWSRFPTPTKKTRFIVFWSSNATTRSIFGFRARENPWMDASIACTLLIQFEAQSLIYMPTKWCGDWTIAARAVGGRERRRFLGVKELMGEQSEEGKRGKRRKLLLLWLLRCFAWEGEWVYRSLLVIHPSFSTAMERLKTNLELCVFFSLLVCPSWSNSMRMHGLAEYGT